MCWQAVPDQNAVLSGEVFVNPSEKLHEGFLVVGPGTDLEVQADSLAVPAIGQYRSYQ